MTRIFKNDKHVFWQALLIALLIFTFGLLIGILVETWRQSTIEDLYVQAELQFMDLRIQNELFDISEISCGNAINENLKFADQIEGIIGTYEPGSKKLVQTAKESGYIVIVYNARYTGESSDVEVRITLQKVDDKIEIAGSWFDSPILRGE